MERQSEPRPRHHRLAVHTQEGADQIRLPTKTKPLHTVKDLAAQKFFESSRVEKTERGAFDLVDLHSIEPRLHPAGVEVQSAFRS